MSPDEVRRLFDYDLETGVLRWRVALGPVRIGGVAGSIASGGYVQIQIAGKKYLAHRLAWCHVHGNWPEDQIDHRDGDTSNNRFANLRDVSNAINQHNLKRANRDSSTGLLGVSPSGKSFCAHIGVNGKVLYLGVYPSPEEAHAAYIEAKRKHHVGFVEAA